MRAWAHVGVVVAASGCLLDRDGQLAQTGDGGSGASGGDMPTVVGPGGNVGVGGAGGVAPGSGGSAGNGGSAGGGGGEPTCPEGPGPTMVLVPHANAAFCIDATEVTSAHYAAFLASSPPLPVTAECDWKSTLVPRAAGQNCAPHHYDPVGLPDRPVACVDWCDAVAYCAWAGKRLCGTAGGGPSDFDDPASLDNEWFHACSNADENVYPYGDVYLSNACVGDDFDGVPNDGSTDEAIDVGTALQCVGSFGGLHDLSGNVWEWSNSCEDIATAQIARCRSRGGSFWDNSTSGYLPCTGVGTTNHTRSFYNKNIGLRCCADSLP